jgi:hypothetical protein
MVWQTPVGLLAAVVSGQAEGGQLPWWVRILFEFSTFVTQAIVTPIMTIAIALVYYDERTRKEAFDLQHMMHQLDQSSVASSAT